MLGGLIWILHPSLTGEDKDTRLRAWPSDFALKCVEPHPTFQDLPTKASTSGTPIFPICTCGTQQLRTVDQGGIRSRHLKAVLDRYPGLLQVGPRLPGAAMTLVCFPDMMT